MTEPRKVGRPVDPGPVVIGPTGVKDWQTRPMFELVLQVHLPTYNEFRGLRLREQMRLRKTVHTAMYDSFKALEIPLTSEHRRVGAGKNTKFQLTWRLDKNMLFPTRAILHATIYRTDKHEPDPQNYV